MNMKKLIIIAILAIFSTSCDETEPILYDGEQTLVYFSRATSVLDVVVDDEGSVDITIGSSTLSTSDRTFNIFVDAEETKTNSQNYSVPATVTIPANEYFGTFTVLGFDFDLETVPETLAIGLQGESGGNVVLTSALHFIAIKQICPVAASFTGAYNLSIVAPGIFGTPTFKPGPVTLTVSATGGVLSRSFEVAPYPAFGVFAPRLFSFSLTCNEIVVPSGQLTGVGCGSSTTIGPSPTKGTYDPNDDTTFDMHLADDEGGASCGAQANAIVRFTKI